MVKRLVCKNFQAFVGASFGLSLQAYASNTKNLNWWGLGSEWHDAPALGWLFLTFFIFIGALIFILKKPLALYLETRSQDIKRAIEEGQKAQAESEQKLRSYDEKLRSLDGEIAKMKSAFLEQAHAERLEKERLTKETSARILKDTEDTIKASFERSKNKLAEEVISSAIAKAQNSILQTYLPEVDSYLKQSLVSDIKNYGKES